MADRDHAAVGTARQVSVGLDHYDQPVDAAVDIKDMQAVQAQE